MSTDFIEELKRNPGCILLPDGRLEKPSLPLLRVWEGDVWCDPKEDIEEPEYEEGTARFFESIVAARLCRKPGTARFNFVLKHVTDLAKGDLFDWKRLYIDRETVPRLPEDETTVCDAFGMHPRRAMNRLKESVYITRETTLQGCLLNRMCWLSLARKVFLARAGFPQFSERQVTDDSHTR